jgi:hypothetical protein
MKERLGIELLLSPTRISGCFRAFDETAEGRAAGFPDPDEVEQELDAFAIASEAVKCQDDSGSHCAEVQTPVANVPSWRPKLTTTPATASGTATVKRKSTSAFMSAETGAADERRSFPDIPLENCQAGTCDWS